MASRLSKQAHINCIDTDTISVSSTEMFGEISHNLEDTKLIDPKYLSNNGKSYIEVIDVLQELQRKITNDAAQRIIEMNGLDNSVADFDIDGLKEKLQMANILEEGSDTIIEIHTSISDLVKTYLKSVPRLEGRSIKLL